jgi:hypothetical protein
MRFRLPGSCATTILVLFASGTMQAADGLPPSPFRNFRTSDAEIRSAISACYGYSLTCHQLIDEIESSSTFVYLSRGQCLPGQVGSCLRFSAASPEARYLHVVLESDLTPDCLLRVTAHELQHVVEVVRAPHVADLASFRLLFARIGFFLRGSGMREDWETEEAQRIASVVSKEVKRSLRAAPLAFKDARVGKE